MEPPPPTVGAAVPYIGAGPALLRDPTAALTRFRARHGDTFLLRAFGFELLFLFSPEGLRSLYRLSESQASFAEATRTLIGFKLPEELLDADMGMFHRLFARGATDRYLGHLREAVAEDLAAMGHAGEIEIFAHMKRLVHRMAFRSWAGPEAATPARLPRLIALFERLDPEEAFLRPGGLARTLITRKAGERRALREIEEVLARIWTERRRAGRAEGDMLEALHEAYASQGPAVQRRRVARDVMILHLASQSNLYAALSWTLVNLLLRPELLARVRAGDDDLLERCAHESIRMAQRSITLRKVVAPCSVDDGVRRYDLSPGVFVATMLSVTNCAHPGLGSFDPDHYERARIAPSVGLPTPEVVSTFGHGQHACPGQRFAILAIRVALRSLLDALDLEPRFDRVSPLPGQIGAVARAAVPCRLRYRRRAGRAVDETSGAALA